MPNVDVLIELADMREANRSYEANLQVAKQSSDLMNQTVSLAQGRLTPFPSPRAHAHGATKPRGARRREPDRAERGAKKAHGDFRHFRARRERRPGHVVPPAVPRRDVGRRAAPGTTFDQMLGQVVSDAVGTLQAGEAAAIQGVQGALPPSRSSKRSWARSARCNRRLAIRDKAVSAYQEITRMTI